MNDPFEETQYFERLAAANAEIALLKKAHTVKDILAIISTILLIIDLILRL